MHTHFLTLAEIGSLNSCPRTWCLPFLTGGFGNSLGFVLFSAGTSEPDRDWERGESSSNEMLGVLSVNIPSREILPLQATKEVSHPLKELLFHAIALQPPQSA